MKEILLHSQEIPFLDATAQKMLAEAREYFRVSNLENTFIRKWVEVLFCLHGKGIG